MEGQPFATCCSHLKQNKTNKLNKTYIWALKPVVMTGKLNTYIYMV